MVHLERARQKSHAPGRGTLCNGRANVANAQNSVKNAGPRLCHDSRVRCRPPKVAHFGGAPSSVRRAETSSELGAPDDLGAEAPAIFGKPVDQIVGGAPAVLDELR